MDNELQQKIFEAFPHLYRNRHLSMKETCMCWGITCGNGWFDLLYKLSSDIDEHLKYCSQAFRDEFAVEQVKEKFGTLRFYTTITNDAIEQFIDEAEEASYYTCEDCGDTNTAKIRKGGWIRTLCDSCNSVNNE